MPVTVSCESDNCEGVAAHKCGDDECGYINLCDDCHQRMLEARRACEPKVVGSYTCVTPERMAVLEAAERQLAAVTAEVERLRACLEPGKAPAIVDGLHQWAKQYGHTDHSSHSPMRAVDQYIKRLTERVREPEVKLHHNKLYDAGIKVVDGRHESTNNSEGI